MGLEKVVIKQVVKVAKDTAKIQDALSTMQDKLVNESLKAFEKTQMNPQLLSFDIEALAKGEIEDPDSVLTPENLCSVPALTEKQKQDSVRAVQSLSSGLTTTIDNINSLKQALITVQQPLQTLETTAQNLDNIVKTVKGAVKVIKAIPIPTAFGMPAIALPVNVLTILSDSLDTLDKLLGAAKGITQTVPKLVGDITGMISETIVSIDEVVSKVAPTLAVCSFIQAKVDLGDSCPNVDQSDINAVQSLVSSDIQTAVSQLGDSSIAAVNVFNEDQLIAALQINSDPPYVYKGFTFILEEDPNNAYSFPARRIQAKRFFSANLQTAETLFFSGGINGTGGTPLQGPIILYNDPGDLGRYSFSSSVQVLVEEMKYKVDQYLLGLREIVNKFNILNQTANDLAVQNIPRDQLDQFNQTNPLPDFVLNGENIVRPEVDSFDPSLGTVVTLGGPISVSGSIQINKPNVKIQMNSFGGTNSFNFVNTILNITPPVGVGLPNQASIISRLTEAQAYSNAQEEYTFPATGSWSYLMRITNSEGGSGQTNFDLISP